MAGVWFDELLIGQKFAHALRRTVTETDKLMTCALTYNPAQVSLNAEYTPRPMARARMR